MDWVDCHAHFFDVAAPDFAFQQMKKNRIIAVFSCGIDWASSQKALNQQQKFSAVKAAIGVHPENVLLLTKNQNKACIDSIRSNAANAIGIGECGLDFKHADTIEKKQKQEYWFEQQLRMATEFDQPVFVHSRNAVDECLLALEKFEVKKALIHWFSGSIEQLNRIEQNQWMISVGPAVFSQKKIQKIAQRVDENALVLETDCPIPFDQKPSDPSWIPAVGQKVAQLRNQTVQKTAFLTTRNAERLINQRLLTDSD